MIDFQIATPEKVVYKDQVSQITLPTKAGEITILPNHLPLVSVIAPGVIKIVKDGEEKFLAVGEGFIEVKPGNRVIIIAENSETAEEIDVARADRARRRARGRR
jgi:F-type H+-transporting ATPase subunit epsilon